MSSGACPGDSNPYRTFVVDVFCPATSSSVPIHCTLCPSLPTEPVASAESEHNFQKFMLVIIHHGPGQGERRKIMWSLG